MTIHKLKIRYWIVGALVGLTVFIVAVGMAQFLNTFGQVVFVAALSLISSGAHYLGILDERIRISDLCTRVSVIDQLNPQEAEFFGKDPLQ